ncbi:hypothetical protein GA0070604_1021 [Micromonospora eburnea]|uniref:Uncharacterized protein n=2 Tax=Micromonosporaceae TaxID=28056 RepID=A0A1C6TUT6_9ACTN|nr:hypothetical protein GA0070604_1021 [Micromonospora eburnea]
MGTLDRMHPSTCSFCGSLHLRYGLAFGVAYAALPQQRQL